MVETEYWKLKAKIAELEIEQMQLRMSLNDVNNKKIALMKEHGLETDIQYRFNDKEFTIERIDGK